MPMSQNIAPLNLANIPLVARRSVDDYFKIEGEYYSIRAAYNGNIGTGSVNVVTDIGANVTPVNRCFHVENIVISANFYGGGFILLSRGLTSGGANSEEIDISVSPGAPLVIPVRQILRQVDGLGASAGWLRMSITKLRNADGTDATLANTLANYTVSLNGRMLYDDINFDADKVALGVGDSVFNTTGRTSKLTCYDWKLRNFYAANQSVRMTMHAISGSTSTQHETLRQHGLYDAYQKIDLIVYELMINDASQSISPSTFTSNLNAIMAMKQARYPAAKMIVLGAHPVQVSATETNLVALRVAAAAAVTAKADPLIKYCGLDPLGTTFSTVNANYASSDGAGTGIHPSDQGDGYIWLGNVAAGGAFTGLQAFLQANFPKI